MHVKSVGKMLPLGNMRWLILGFIVIDEANIVFRGGPHNMYAMLVYPSCPNNTNSRYIVISPNPDLNHKVDWWLGHYV